jgi:hypothetical protein
VNRYGVRTAGVTASASHEFHAQNFGVELARPIKIIDRDPNVVKLFELHIRLLVTHRLLKKGHSCFNKLVWATRRVQHERKAFGNFKHCFNRLFWPKGCGQPYLYFLSCERQGPKLRLIGWSALS